jgi:hypothetical protein
MVGLCPQERPTMRDSGRVDDALQLLRTAYGDLTTLLHDLAGRALPAVQLTAAARSRSARTAAAGSPAP